MNYCTLEDIRGHVPEARLVEITDDNNPNNTGKVNTAIVDKAIEESSATIDSYIGKRFRLPLPSVPSVLRSICIDLSIYNLYERVTETDVTDGMQLRYKNAIKQLERIAEGLNSIGISEEPIDDAGFAVSSNGGPSIFNLGSMRF